MSYEVLYSDTSREDLEKNTDEALHALLERIAASGDFDHILSAPESQFELRYQSEGTLHVFFRREEAARRVTIVYFCYTRVGAGEIGAAVGKPGVRILEQQTREVPHGQEVQGLYEMRRGDGSAVLNRTFMRKIDMGDSYVVVHQMAIGTNPAVTMLVSGVKGEIEGDQRHDQVGITLLAPDGTVRQLPPQPVAVMLKNPFEGLSGQVLMDRVSEWVRSPEMQERVEASRRAFL